MPIAIRRAVPQDAQAIVELLAVAFQEEANPAHIQSLIEEGEHLTFVAEDEGIVGFIDGFYTLGLWDLMRLELDLLAVHPEHSGKGIGKALIQKFTESQEKAAFIRALVAVDNTPMHHAMRAMGYKQNDEFSFGLYIASEGEAFPSTRRANLIPVKTFTYTGIWLEGSINRETIKAAHYMREYLGYEIVGTLCPVAYIDLVETGFRFVKNFHWWNFQLISDEEINAKKDDWFLKFGYRR